MAAPSLLTTKYAPPPLRSDIVVRPGLVPVLADPRIVTVISAPPGYGKTTLVLGWLAGETRAVAWLTLDDSDDDPGVFLAYLMAAARRAVPGLGDELEQALNSPPYTPSTLTPLLNELGSAGLPVTLVLDDYHAIRAREVHEMVAFLATHLPPAVRLVIASRQDPPLPLARLRARGELTEIRAADLRLEAPEAARFLRESMRLEISDRAAERLAERTEGWVAGLQLAGLSLRCKADPDAFVDAFGASDRYIVDYLAEEALALQPPEIRSFLEDTSVLDRLTGPLCDVLTGRTDGDAMLAALEQSNLFLTPLDERREWFQYHGLFADFLRSGLPAPRRVALHRAAARWLADHELPVQAIRHLMAANDHEPAAELVERAADQALARGEFRTVVGWCDALPAAVVSARPRLRLARAWARFFLGDLEPAEATVRDLSESALEADPIALCRLAGLEAWLANRRDSPNAERLARRAVETAREQDPVFRCLALGTLGESLLGHDPRGARAAFAEALDLSQFAPRSTLSLGTVYSLANAELELGRRREAEDLCRRTITESGDRRGSGPPAAGMVHVALGVALYEADELGQARQHLATGFELCDRAGLHVTMLGAGDWYEVLTLHLLGEVDQAWRRLEAVRREAGRLHIERLVVAMSLLASELLVTEGDPRAAARRLEEVPAAFSNLLGTMTDRIRQGQARVLLALERPRDAVDILDPLAVEQRASGRQGKLMRTLALKARACELDARIGDPMTVLAEVIALGCDQGYRRVFLDPAASVGHALSGLRALAPEFVDDVLRRLPDVRSRPGSGSPVRRGEAAAPAATGDGERAEPLTLRELDVLRLVVAGLSNDEIGRELFLTVGTVKWHVHNVLAKVGARDRVALVARSRTLGLS